MKYIHGEMLMNNTQKAMIATAIAVGALITGAAVALYVKELNEQKKIGGKLLKVNYKFCKEYE